VAAFAAKLKKKVVQLPCAEFVPDEVEAQLLKRGGGLEQ
jgi:hypothetical protein